MAGSTPQDGAVGAPQHRHMTPCVCHCAACRADGHGIGACVVLCAGLHDVFDGKADVVDLVLRHGAAHSGACRWGAARFGAVIICVQYGPAGDVIAAGDQHGHIHLICAQTGENILSSPQENNRTFGPPATIVRVAVLSLAFSPGGQLIAAGDGNPDDPFEAGTVRIHCASTGQVERVLRGHSRSVYSVSWCPKGEKILSGSGDHTIKIWDANSGECEQTLEGHEDDVNSACFDPTGRMIASSSDDTTVRLWDSATGAAIGSPLTGHSGMVPSVSWAPDGKRLASGSHDRTARK